MNFRQAVFFLMLFFLLLINHEGTAQYSLKGKSVRTLKSEKVDFSRHLSPVLPSSFVVKKEGRPDLLISSSLPEVNKVPSIYRFDELGLFCKFEVQIEKATRFPVKIRLGEVEAVDRKEGKWQYDNIIH